MAGGEDGKQGMKNEQEWASLSTGTPVEAAKPQGAPLER